MDFHRHHRFRRGFVNRHTGMCSHKNDAVFTTITFLPANVLISKLLP